MVLTKNWCMSKIIKYFWLLSYLILKKTETYVKYFIFLLNREQLGNLYLTLGIKCVVENLNYAIKLVECRVKSSENKTRKTAIFVKPYKKNHIWTVTDTTFLLIYLVYCYSCSVKKKKIIIFTNVVNILLLSYAKNLILINGIYVYIFLISTNKEIENCKYCFCFENITEVYWETKVIININTYSYAISS